MNTKFLLQKISAFFLKTLGIAALHSTLIANDLKAETNSCAKIEFESGSKCPKPHAKIKLEGCEEKLEGSVETNCKGEKVELKFSTDKAQYIAKYLATESWGEASFLPQGEIERLVKPVKKEEPKKEEPKKILPVTQGTPPSAPKVVALLTPSTKVRTPVEKPKATLSWGALLDTYYSLNLNRPEAVTSPSTNLPAGNTQYRYYDQYHNQFALNLAEISFKRSGDELGFVLDLDAGQATDLNHTSGSTVDEVSKHIGQAVVSYVPESMPGWSFSFGKMYTHLGYEVAKAKDNWQYSRSYIYGYSIPIWHMGLAIGFPLIQEKLSGTFYLYNGWNNLYDNNQGKSFGLQLKATPNDKLTLFYNLIAGPEKANKNSEWKIVNEANATYSLRENLSLAIEVVYGTEMDTDQKNDAQWVGTSIHAKWNHDDYSLSPRFEFYRDVDGYSLATNQGTNASSLTLTQALKLHEALELRLEGRYDFVTRTIFTTTDGGSSKHQASLSLAALLNF